MLDLSKMAKNYSHCPLKKRPIQFLEETHVDENVEKPVDARKRICVRTPPPVKIEICDEEPENLCTKDHRKHEVSVIKHVAPVVPIPLNPTTIEAPVALRLHNHQGFQRVQTPVRSELQNYAPTTWCRSVGSVAPAYPPAYMPLYYPNQEIYNPYALYSSPPYEPRDNSCSPPTYRQSEPRMPELSLSPTSSNESPADLSSPPPPSTSSSTSSRSQRHQCPDCGKSYSTFSGLSKHRQFHCAASNDGPRKSFSCKYCDKVYVSLGALKMHIRTHTLPCKCTLCGKAFSRPWLLQGHIRTHTGEKPFSCQHCHRAFADRSNLRAHLQTHSDIKKYSCGTCSKTFSRMSLLTKHTESGGACSQTPQPMLYQPTSFY